MSILQAACIMYMRPIVHQYYNNDIYGHYIVNFDPVFWSFFAHWTGICDLLTLVPPAHRSAIDNFFVHRLAVSDMQLTLMLSILLT